MAAGEMILRYESELRQLTLNKQSALSDPEAQRHLQGLVHRHYMMQSSRLFLSDLFDPPPKKALSVYQSTDCMIHLNSYYLNLRGVLDNLAWILQYEQKILSGITENTPSRQSCYLFGKKFIAALHCRIPDLASFLSRRLKWSEDLAELRDPAAHRVPIYVPRSVLVSDEQRREYERILGALSDPTARGENRYADIHEQADNVGKCLPVMILSNSDNVLKVRWLLRQLMTDHVRYLSIARRVLLRC